MGDGGSFVIAGAGAGAGADASEEGGAEIDEGDDEGTDRTFEIGDGESAGKFCSNLRFPANSSCSSMYLQEIITAPKPTWKN